MMPSIQTHPQQVQLKIGATQPVTSFIAVVIGGFVAYLLLPEDYWMDPGALRASGIAMASGLMFSIVLAVSRSPLAIFRAELILMGGLVYWLVLDAIQVRYGLQVGRIGVERLFAGVSIFAASFWLGAALVGPLFRGQEPYLENRSDIGRSFLFWSAVVCALMGLSYKTLGCHLQVDCIYKVLMLPRGSTSWLLDPTFAPLKRLRYAGYLAAPLAVAYFLVERRLTWRGAIILFLTFLNLLLLLTDGRRSLGTTLGAAVLIYILLRPRIRMRHLLAMSGAILAILILLEAMVAWRHVGIGRSFMADASIETGSGIISVDKNIYHGSRAMALVPERHPHTGWKGLAYTFGDIIPRRIWQRPAKFGFDYIGITNRPGGRGWTATFSVIGDLWVIGGYMALVLGGIFYGALAHLTSRLLLRPLTIRDRLLYTISVMALFVSLRAFYEIIITGLAVAALWGLLWIRDIVLVRRKLELQPSGPVSQSPVSTKG